MVTFITGACGFVGLALTEHLLAAGGTVVGYDMQALPVTAARRFAMLPGRCMFESGDVCEVDALTDAVGRHRPDRLVSLAAVTAGLARERRFPGTVAAVNIAGAWNATMAAATHGVTRVVHVSSGAVYGHSGRSPTVLHEETALLPEGLYGVSKQAAEAGVVRLAQLHGLDLVVARLGTCFGPWEADTGVRDTFSAPLQIVQRAMRGEEVVLPRAGRRDWLYARDAAAGLAALLDAPVLSHRVYNVASGYEWSMVEWCALLQTQFPGLAWHIASAEEPPNIDYYAAYDRASMAPERLIADSCYIPIYDMRAAAADYLAWLCWSEAATPASQPS